MADKIDSEAWTGEVSDQVRKPFDGTPEARASLHKTARNVVLILIALVIMYAAKGLV